MKIGITSLLNEFSSPYKRGDRLSYIDKRGVLRTGSYVMASSADGYVVLNMGGAHGTPAVVWSGDILERITKA